MFYIYNIYLFKCLTKTSNIMKNRKKVNFKLEKEVISQLTEDYLNKVLGGGGPNTFNSICLCQTDAKGDCKDTNLITGKDKTCISILPCAHTESYCVIPPPLIVQSQDGKCKPTVYEKVSENCTKPYTSQCG